MQMSTFHHFQMALLSHSVQLFKKKNQKEKSKKKQKNGTDELEVVPQQTIAQHVGHFHDDKMFNVHNSSLVRALAHLGYVIVSIVSTVRARMTA
jgi:hypothetical protein